MLPVGKTNSFDGVVAVVDFVAGFKHNTEPPTAKALYWLKVSQIPGQKTVWLSWKKRITVVSGRNELSVTSVLSPTLMTSPKTRDITIHCGQGGL